MILRPTKIPHHIERLISVPYVAFSFWDRGGQRDDRFCQDWLRRSWIQLLCAGSICSFVTETFHVPWGAQPPIVVQCNVSSVPVPALAIHLSGRLRLRGVPLSSSLPRMCLVCVRGHGRNDVPYSGQGTPIQAATWLSPFRSSVHDRGASSELDLA
jgi:hypothetical protein